MDQAELNRVMNRWGDAQVRRFLFRVALFMRRGLPEDTAERVADRLAFRDQDLDERRLCIECVHIKPLHRCVINNLGIRGVLHRCPSFQFETP